LQFRKEDFILSHLFLWPRVVEQRKQNKKGENVNEIDEQQPSRSQIAIRLLYTILYLIVFEVLKAVFYVTVLFQYVYLFITRKYSQPLRNFSNKLAAYAFRIIRYTTLNEHVKPFPFQEFPSEMEPPQDPVRFD